MTDRTAIPAELERAIKVEAGHRCAIPTCRTIPVEIAHIIPWEKVQEHKFDNLIALCPTCHTRYHNGNIDRKSMVQYKANLSILNGRYCDIEKRILSLFGKNPKANIIWLPGGFDIIILNLVEDGLLVETGKNSGVIMSGMPSQKEYKLTEKGRDFVKRWINAETIE